MAEMTTIAISMETKEALAKLGGKGDTYESIIKRLLTKKPTPKLYNPRRDLKA